MNPAFIMPRSGWASVMEVVMVLLMLAAFLAATAASAWLSVKVGERL